jgi:hypothetical protein
MTINQIEMHCTNMNEDNNELMGIQLPVSELELINDKLPDISEIQKITNVNIEIIALYMGHDSHLDIAFVALKDASRVLSQSRFALTMAHVNNIWYLKYCKHAPKTSEAIWHTKYYLDDVALRFYAACEHIADSIINFLSLDNKTIKNQREVSCSAKVGHFLKNNYPSHPITIAVKKLFSYSEWTYLMAYRRFWIHEQPPLIKGLGIVFKRKSRWQKCDDGYQMSFVMGDNPDITIDDLMTKFEKANNQFVSFFKEICSIYQDTEPYQEYLKSIEEKFL